MDNEIILYIVKVSIAILMFYGIYILFLRKDTFNKTKRYYLLFSVGASLLLPLWTVNLNVMQETTAMFTEVFLPQILISPDNNSTVEAMEQNQISAFNFSTIIFYTLVSGVILLFIRLVIQLLSILRIRVNSDILCDENTRMILMNENVAPFSFFNWIFA